MMRIWGALITVVMLACAWAGEAPAGGPSTGRQVLDLNEDWSFSYEATGRPNKTTPQVPVWSPVTLPHTWNQDDGAQALKPYRRGVGHYRRTLRAPQEWRGQSVFLTVGAANARAWIRVNGRLVLDHITGFTAFTADLSRALRFGDDNELEITVDNRYNLEYPPLQADYTFFGGIHRGVRLTITRPVHISLTDHASSGVYLVPKVVTRERAEVEVRVCLANDTDTAVSDAVVAVEVMDGAGQRVLHTSSEEQTLPAQGAVTLAMPIAINQPHLWDGRNDPHLYRVRIAVQRGEQVLDGLVQPLGLRWFSVDASKGFLLNGRPYDLHGAALHQDRPAKGWAISDADRAEDVSLLKEVGATCVRLVHYPHAPATLDLLDEAGIIAWCEIPVAYGIGTQPAFGVNCRTMLVEMIRQLYNHPSICVWGLFNEITAIRRGGLELITELNRVAKEEDPTRLTTAAAGTVDNDAICGVTDVIAFNRYMGWFLPGVNLFASWAEGGHNMHPQRCMGLAEYGAEGRVDQHADRRSRNTANVLQKDSRMGTEEYQAQLHEEVWSQINGLPFLWCKLAWNLTDWSTAGPKSMTLFPSDGVGRMGFVTHDRKIRKDTFFWYKANWSQEPVLYLCERRFTPREYREADIRVYSNISERLKLMVNGEVVMVLPEQFGKRTIWPDVRLPAGKVQVTVQATRNGKLYQDSLEWEVPDRLPPDAATKKQEGAKGF